MSKLFIYSNSFVAKTIIYKLCFVLNISIDEVLLLNENHRQNEEGINTWCGCDINLYADIDECINLSDYIFIIRDSNVPTKHIDYILKQSVALGKKCFELNNHWREYSLCKSKCDELINLNFEKFPVILNISLGPTSQQYCLEVLINSIFEKSKVNIKQIFSPATYSFFSQLNSYKILNSSLSAQLDNQKVFSVMVCSLDIGVDFNNITKYIDMIKNINPDFIILQTNIRFDEYETAKNIFKYGCLASLDLIVKSHFNTITLEDVNVVYCSNHITSNTFIKDLESIDLESELKSNIFSKLSLPKGVLRL